MPNNQQHLSYFGGFLIKLVTSNKKWVGFIKQNLTELYLHLSKIYTAHNTFLTDQDLGREYVLVT